MAIRLPKKFQHLSENVLNMRANSKPNSVREGCSGANLRRRQLANGKTVREVIQCWIANGCGTSGRNGRPFSECRSPEDSAWGALRWEINNGRITLTESLSPSKAWIQAEEDAAAVNQSLESERRRIRSRLSGMTPVHYKHRPGRPGSYHMVTNIRKMIVNHDDNPQPNPTDWVLQEEWTDV